MRYLGEVSGANKDRFLDSLDLLVVPSEYEENAPLVLAEAGVRGLPAIVSDRGGLPETPYAQIFRARDVDSLIAVLLRNVTNPELVATVVDRIWR